MKRIALALALVLGIASQAVAGTGRAYVPISACKTGGSFGTGTWDTDVGGNAFIGLSGAVNGQYLTCDFWFPGSASTASLTIDPRMDIDAVAACGNIYLFAEHQTSPAGSNSSNINTNFGTGADSATQAAAPLATASRLIKLATPLSVTSYDQGSAGNCASAAACANEFGRFRVTRDTTPGSNCASTAQMRGFYVYWSTP